MALEAANIQWSDERHILEAVLHAHSFGPFVLEITSQFHHLWLPLYIPFISPKVAPGPRRSALFLTAFQGQEKNLTGRRRGLGWPEILTLLQKQQQTLYKTA